MKETLISIKEFFQFSIVTYHDNKITVGVIIAIILAFMVTSYLLKVTKKLITRKMDDEDKNKFTSIFQFFQYLVYLFVVMFTLKSVGVDISPLLTASAAIFLGLGFALQQLFQDLISGVLIIIDQTLHVGDIIEVGGTVCKVEKISLRSTKAVTRDNRVIIIPNHKFLSDMLINWTQNSTEVRSKVSVGVAYGSDTKLVEQILIKVAKENKDVLNKHNPFVLFEDFGDSSLDFALIFHVKNGLALLRIQSDLRFEIDKAFRENNITIPFPQRDVHMFNHSK